MPAGEMKNIPIRNLGNSANEPVPSGRFSIRNIADLLSGNDMIQTLHRHDFFFILILEKGEGNHEIDFTEYGICDNSVFIIRPGQVHQLALRAGSTGYLIQFPVNFMQDPDALSNRILRDAGKVNFQQFDATDFKKLLSVSDYIFDEFTNKQPDYHQIIKANLTILLIEMQRMNQTDLSQKGSYAQERLDEFSSLLETHFTSHKQVSQYAALLNLTTYQLNSLTKNLLGKTCSQLINAYIVLECKRYLLATSKQINEIAFELGYEDTSYFSRFFRKQTGHSPESFRQNFK
jgi:AraC-like DNA-binding protein